MGMGKALLLTPSFVWLAYCILRIAPILRMGVIGRM